MIRLAAHLGYQFQEFEPGERFRQAARAGFRAVEWPGVYAMAANDLHDLTRELNLEWVQVALPMGGPGEQGLAAVPGRRAEFERGLESAIGYAKTLGARWIHPMAGIVPEWNPEVEATYLGNLRTAVAAATEAGLGTLVEVIGDGEVPGYAMCRYERAESMLGHFADDQVQLLLDAYHAQVLTGSATAVARRWAGRIGHVQIADVPGRHEPGTGALDFADFFAVLDEGGYEGWVGCEYKPLGSTLEGLWRLAPYFSQRGARDD